MKGKKGRRKELMDGSRIGWLTAQKKDWNKKMEEDVRKKKITDEAKD